MMTSNRCGLSSRLWVIVPYSFYNFVYFLVILASSVILPSLHCLFHFFFLFFSKQKKKSNWRLLFRLLSRIWFFTIPSAFFRGLSRFQERSGRTTGRPKISIFSKFFLFQIRFVFLTFIGFPLKLVGSNSLHRLNPVRLSINIVLI